MEPAELRALLKDLGIRPSKRRGQCFLIDDKVARMQVRFADIKENEVVLEVGPGLGVLTRLLAEKAKRVVAIEQDKRFMEHLEDIPNTEVIQGDALKVEFPKFDKVVSNLPYQISSPITFKFLEHDFSCAVLMYQREFAERLVTESGRESSRLSVKLHYRAENNLIGTVPINSFYPQPKVEGAIVIMRPREKPPFHVMDEALYFKVVDCIYAHRRKKIFNCLVGRPKLFSKGKDEMRALAKGLPFTDRRAEELEPGEIAQLSNNLSERLI